MTQQSRRTISTTTKVGGGLTLGFLLAAFVALRPLAGMPERLVELEEWKKLLSTEIAGLPRRVETLENWATNHDSYTPKGYERLAANEAADMAREARLNALESQVRDQMTELRGQVAEILKEVREIERKMPQ